MEKSEKDKLLMLKAANEIDRLRIQNESADGLPAEMFEPSPMYGITQDRRSRPA